MFLILIMTDEIRKAHSHMVGGGWSEPDVTDSVLSREEIDTAQGIPNILQEVWL